MIVLAMGSLGHSSTPSVEVINDSRYELTDTTPTQPEPDIMAQFISGTEYRSGEQGQGIVQVLDFNKNALSGDCNLSIYYPNKTIWINNLIMLPSGVAGTYYLNFTTATQEGIYEEYALCTVGTKTVRTSSTFHVSPTLNTIISFNMSAEQKLQTIIDNLNANNLTLMQYLNATNQSYMQFMTNIQNNQTFWFPQIYNNQVYWFPLLNQSIANIQTTINNLNTSMSANFTEMLTYLDWIWHNGTYKNLTLTWSTNASSTFRAGEYIQWDTLVLNSTGGLFNGAQCNLTAYYPSSAVWLLNKTETKVADGWYRYGDYLPKGITGTYSWNVTCIRA